MGLVPRRAAPIEVDVSPEVAALLITGEMSKTPDKRSIMQLTAGDIPLGAWQVIGVRTTREGIGNYERFLATFRAVWE